MRPAGIYKNHELLTYISRSTDFGQIIKMSKVDSEDLLMIAC